MNLTIALYNKTQIVAGFIPQAMRIAELFNCALEMKVSPDLQPMLPGMDLWPVQAGPVAFLEIVVRGEDAAEAIQAMRRRMSQSFSELNFQSN